MPDEAFHWIAPQSVCHDPPGLRDGIIRERADECVKEVTVGLGNRESSECNRRIDGFEVTRTPHTYNIAFEGARTKVVAIRVIVGRFRSKYLTVVTVHHGTRGT